jgi:hypothetical protein
MENTSIKKKSFWERPEGTTGMAFIAIAVVAFFIGANTILPFIIGVLQNTLYTMFLLGCIGAVGVLVANDRFRTAVTTLFQLAMRKLTGFVVEIDPIGILKNYVSTLMKKLGVMDEHIGELRGQIVGLKRKIEEKIQERNTFLARAEQYQKQGNSPLDVQLNARSAARDDDMIKSLTGNLQ